jgi:hypothetical protein
MNPFLGGRGTLIHPTDNGSLTAHGARIASIKHLRHNGFLSPRRLRAPESEVVRYSLRDLHGIGGSRSVAHALNSLM